MSKCFWGVVAWKEHPRNLWMIHPVFIENPFPSISIIVHFPISRSSDNHVLRDNSQDVLASTGSTEHDAHHEKLVDRSNDVRLEERHIIWTHRDIATKRLEDVRSYSVPIPGRLNPAWVAPAALMDFTRTRTWEVYKKINIFQVVALWNVGVRHSGRMWNAILYTIHVKLERACETLWTTFQICPNISAECAPPVPCNTELGSCWMNRLGAPKWDSQSYSHRTGRQRPHKVCKRSIFPLAKAKQNL